MKRFILGEDGNIAEMFVMFILFLINYSLMEKKTPHVVMLNRHLKHAFNCPLVVGCGQKESPPPQWKLTRSIDFEKILFYFSRTRFYKRPNLKG